jgi:hypothetical protein
MQQRFDGPQSATGRVVGIGLALLAAFASLLLAATFLVSP